MSIFENKFLDNITQTLDKYIMYKINKFWRYTCIFNKYNKFYILYTLE